MDIDEHIDSWYSEHYDEIERLRIDAAGRLERERTKELLLRFLPQAPARILDVGGGPGVYASWLAELGHEVTLIDPVARHLEQARAYGTFPAQEGDARALSAADESADAVLMLGPLYHLVDPADRARALAEAHRVVRPGGLIAAAFISRHSPIIDCSAQLLVNDDALYEHLRRLRHTGENDPSTGFTVAYFHSVEEIHADFAAAGLAAAEVYAIEGPLLPLLRSGFVEDRPEFFEAALRAARLVEDDPAMLAATAHLLAVTRKA